MASLVNCDWRASKPSKQLYPNDFWRALTHFNSLFKQPRSLNDRYRMITHWNLSTICTTQPPLSNRSLFAAVVTCWIRLSEAVCGRYNAYCVLLWKSAMQRLRGTGCVPFFCLGGDRELVFLARSLVTGWQDSEPSCAGGMHFRFLSVPFFPYRSACVSFSFYSTYFDSPSISIRVISSGAYRLEHVWAPTPGIHLLAVIFRSSSTLQWLLVQTRAYSTAPRQTSSYLH